MEEKKEEETAVAPSHESDLVRENYVDVIRKSFFLCSPTNLINLVEAVCC